MPTNEERRQIAAKLRNAEIENIGLTYSAHLGEAIGECVRLVSGHEGIVKGGLNRLADLIEPEERKCRNKHPQQGGFWCSECDAALDGYIDVSGLVKQINYCPNCGAKVVD